MRTRRTRRRPDARLSVWCDSSANPLSPSYTEARRGEVAYSPAMDRKVVVDGGPASTPGYRAEAAELVRVVTVAGIVVGAIVGGLGSRIAMLVLRLTSPAS